MLVVKRTLIVVLAVIAAFILTIIASLAKNAWESHSLQSSLDPFYTTPEEFSKIPGTLVRYEPLGAEVAGAQAYRMLYVTEDFQGNPAVAAGMAFIPNEKAENPRPVVAYIAGTTGQGDACAPSRSSNPIAGVRNFLPEAIDQGWAVVAPDEYGVGTQGIQLYLIK